MPSRPSRCGTTAGRLAPSKLALATAAVPVLAAAAVTVTAASLLARPVGLVALQRLCTPACCTACDSSVPTSPSLPHAPCTFRSPHSTPPPLVQLGSTAIAVRTDEGVVLAVEKRVTSPLLVRHGWLLVDGCWLMVVGCCMAGCGAAPAGGGQASDQPAERLWSSCACCGCNAAAGSGSPIGPSRAAELGPAERRRQRAAPQVGACCWAAAVRLPLPLPRFGCLSAGAQQHREGGGD